jgi:hypothetical protein
MSDNQQDSGADAPKLTLWEKNLKKGRVKLFLDANLKPELIGPFKHHIHLFPYVPWQILRQWKKRGFRPLKQGVAHVRFEGNEKKFVFPAYFRKQKVKV